MRVLLVFIGRIMLEAGLSGLINISIKSISKPRDDERERINKEIRTKFKTELSQINIDRNRTKLPTEIVSIIMKMLPEINEHWENYKTDSAKAIDHKINLILSTAAIYPTIRFIANLAYFIIIMEQYGKWYGDHKNLSNWDKYCAFIFSLFYMPNLKIGIPPGLGLILIKEIENYKILQGFIYSGAVCDVLYLIFVILVSFPIVMSGIFVYITTLLLLITAWLCLCVPFWGVSWWMNGNDIKVDKQNLKAVGSMMMYTILGCSAVFLTYAYLIVTVMSTMEFYSGESWGKSYAVGVTGDYCNDNDFSSVQKLQDQPAIQFLLLSWILF